MKRVLFGGTFDPVHNGHVVMVQILLESYDSVIIMPAAVSPFKTGTHASNEARLDMLHFAFDGIEGVFVDSYEIDKGGVSYTIDTLVDYPDCDCAVGADSMLTLATWKSADAIRAGTNIVVVARDGAPDCEQAIYDWTARGGQVKLLGRAPRYSSSGARLRLGLEGRCDFLPIKVNDYAVSHHLYESYGDIKSLYVRFHLKSTRIQHSYGVAYTALSLAEQHGGDTHTVIRAALLHDIAKYVTIEEAISLGVQVSSRARESADGVRHAHLGADIAQQLLQEPPEIVDAIRWHTTGKAGQSEIALYVTLADYIEPARNFEGVEELRALARINLYAAIVRMFERTLAHLNTKGKIIDPETLNAYNYYNEILKKGKKL